MITVPGYVCILVKYICINIFAYILALIITKRRRPLSSPFVASRAGLQSPLASVQLVWTGLGQALSLGAARLGRRLETYTTPHQALLHFWLGTLRSPFASVVVACALPRYLEGTLTSHSWH